MNLQLTAIYASLLTLLYIVLTFIVVGGRRKTGTGLLDGGHSSLVKSIRAHGNFSEFVPLTLLLMAFAESSEYLSNIGIHIVGVVLILARIGHALGLRKSQGTSNGRFFGAGATFAIMIFLSINILWNSFVSM